MRDHRDHRRAARLHADSRLREYRWARNTKPASRVSNRASRREFLGVQYPARGLDHRQTRIEMSALMSLEAIGDGGEIFHAGDFSEPGCRRAEPCRPW